MGTVRISDHAVIRYLERHYGFDFEAVRREMDTPALQLAGEMGAEALKWNGGRLIIRDQCAVTFLANKMPPKKKERVA